MHIENNRSRHLTNQQPLKCNIRFAKCLAWILFAFCTLAHSKISTDEISSRLFTISTWKTGDSAANISGSSAGQSFIANSPYVVSASLNIGSTSGVVTFRIFPFNTDADPAGALLSLQPPTPIAECFTTISNYGVTECSNWNRVPYLKVGMKYYMEATSNTGAIHLYFSKTKVYHSGNAFINRALIQYAGHSVDLNIRILGGYPSVPRENLDIVSIWKGGTEAWNASGKSFGQSFVANTRHIKSVIVNFGNNSSGLATARLYHYDPSTNTIGNPIGQECSSIMNSYSQTTFDWAASNLPPLLVDVGRAYYIEFFANSGSNIQIYGSNNDAYTHGSSFISKSAFIGDLNIQIRGFDYSTGVEKVFSEWQSEPDVWNQSTKSAGQVFMATTPYIIDATCNAAGSGKIEFRVFEYSGNTNAPRGKQVGEPTTTPIWSFGATVGSFAKPIPVQVGKLYYIQVASGNTFQIYGGKIKLSYIETPPSPDNIAFVNDLPYYHNGQYTNLNFSVNGLSTGGIYLGNAVGANIFFDNSGLDQFESIQRLNSSWVRADFSLSDTSSDNKDKLIELVESERNGGLIGILKYDQSLVGKRNSVAQSEFIQRATKLAAKYKGKHIIWEILNEPNLTLGDWNVYISGIYPDEYSELVKRVSAAMRAVDSSVWIGAGSHSHLNYWYTNNTISIDGFADAIDFYTFHPYFQRLPENGLSDWLISRRQAFARKSIKHKIPQFFASEYGIHEQQNILNFTINSTGSDAFNMTANSFGQIYTASSEAIRSVSINTGSISGVAAMKIYEYSGVSGQPKGALVSVTPFISPLANYGFTTFLITNDNPIEFVVGKKYYFEFTNPQGSLHLYLSNQDNTSEDIAFVNNTPAQYAGHPVYLNISIASATISGEAGTLTQKESAIYTMRYILTQMKENSVGSIIYKHAEYNGDNWGIYGGGFSEKPISYAVRHLLEIFNKRTSPPSFAISATNAYVVSKTNGTSLAIAIWKGKSATFNYSTLESIFINSSEFTKNIRIYSDLQNPEITTINPGEYSLIDGQLKINNISVGSNPILILIDK